jgi:aromatic ring-cleaving dioxygenase
MPRPVASNSRNARQIQNRDRRVQRRTHWSASDLAFNVIFEDSEFWNIVPWLMLNPDGLDVLVHPPTESSYDDHSKNALWLGTPVPMRLEILRPQYRESLLSALSGRSRRIAFSKLTIERACGRTTCAKLGVD